SLHRTNLASTLHPFNLTESSTPSRVSVLPSRSSSERRQFLERFYECGGASKRALSAAESWLLFIHAVAAAGSRLRQSPMSLSMAVVRIWGSSIVCVHPIAVAGSLAARFEAYALTAESLICPWSELIQLPAACGS